jgi:hypothetical protein
MNAMFLAMQMAPGSAEFVASPTSKCPKPLPDTGGVATKEAP